MKYFLIFFILLIVGFFIWKNLTLPKSTGVIDGKLHSCPNTPNCVSSYATDSEHTIAPLHYTSKHPLNVIQQYFSEHYRSTVVKKTPDYMHLIITSPTMRFNDDLEFLVDKENQTIQVRSASRVGYSDLGMNRKRIEQLRDYLK